MAVCANFAGADTVRNECIGDERPVAPKRRAFGAHDRDSLHLRDCDELIQRGRKLRRLHVVSEPAEAGVAPGGVRGGIACGLSEAAERGHVLVGDARASKRRGERIGLVLGIVARAWNRAHISEQLNAGITDIAASAASAGVR